MSSIEGEIIILKSQKIVPKISPPRLTKALTGETITIYPISLEVNGYGEIRKEYSPKINIFNSSALLNQGDNISGVSLWGFHTIPLKANSIQKGGSARSGKHTRQYVSIDDKCFLQIVTSYKNEVTSIHPKDLYLLV